MVKEIGNFLTTENIDNIQYQIIIRHILFTIFIITSLASILDYSWAVNKAFLRLEASGHVAMIRDLFFFDNGKRLISASEDKTIHIWDISNPSDPKLVKTIRSEIERGRVGKIYALAIDPSERIIAVGGYLYNENKDIYLTAAIRLHKLKTGRIIQVLKGHEREVLDLAFSPDGKYLASASVDKTVIIWKKEKDRYKFHKRLEGHKHVVNALAFSQDRLATGSYDGTVRLYDVKHNFQLIKILRDHKSWLGAVAFSPSSYYLITGSYDKWIFLYDKNGNFIRKFSKRKNHPVAFAFSLDGRYLITGSFGRPNICYLYHFPSGKIKHIFRGHKDTISAVSATLRNGKYLFAAGGGVNHEIFLWTEKGKILSKIKSKGAAIYSIAVGNKKIAFGQRKYESGWKANDYGPLEWIFDLNKMMLKKT